MIIDVIRRKMDGISKEINVILTQLFHTPSDKKVTLVLLLLFKKTEDTAVPSEHPQAIPNSPKDVYLL